MRNYILNNQQNSVFPSIIILMAQFTQYYQVDFLNEFWASLRPEAQLFYDKGSELFLFREMTSVFVINKHSLNKVTRILIPYNENIDSLSIQTDYHFIAYRTSPTQLNIFSIRFNRQFFYKTEKPNYLILQFEWVRGLSGLADLIVIQSNGIRLLKIDDAIRDVKFIAQKISSCWYEPRNEVLVTANEQQNGQLSTFFFNEKRKDQKFKGPDFFLDDFEPKDSGFASMFRSKRQDVPIFKAPSDRKNRDLSNAEPIDSEYQIYVMELYGKSVLAYANSFSGKILFYLLTYESVTKQRYTLSFPSDIIVNLSVVDNLIILSTINEKISIGFDVKKTRPDAPLGPPQAFLQQTIQQPIRMRDIERKSQKQKEQEKPQEKDKTQEQEPQAQVETVGQQIGQVGRQQEEQSESPKKTHEFQPEQEQQLEARGHQENQELRLDSDKKLQEVETQSDQKFSDLYFVYDVKQLENEIQQSQNHFDTFLVKMKWSTFNSAQTHHEEAQSKLCMYPFHKR